MTQFRKAAPALIADDDEEFLLSIKADPKAELLPPVIARFGREAQALLADNNQHFSGVFVNPTIKSPHAISVIRFTHLHRPSTPVFLIHKGECPYDAKELKHLGIEKAIQKPVTYTSLLSLVAPSVAIFDSESAIEISAKNSDTLDTEVTAEDALFTSIRADNFLAGSKSFFDVYVRLDSGRYLKLLKAGDQFSHERISAYLKKGITHFYLRREAQEHYIAYTDKLASTLLKSNKVDIQVKVSQILNQGEETFKFLKDQGISETNLQHAANFITNVHKVVDELQPGKQPLLKGFLSDINSYDHGVATSIIAAMLIQGLNISSSDPAESIGIACLLHDIGIFHLKLNEFDEDESKMTDEQKKAFHTHPTVGAEILRSVSRLKPVVLQAVEQHHERRTKKGFPYQIGPGSLSLVAEIVGLSDEFQRIISKRTKDPSFDFNFALEQHIFHSFSNSIVAEFKKVFCLNNEIKESLFTGGEEKPKETAEPADTVAKKEDKDPKAA